MQIIKAAIQDIPQVKQLWNICFEDGCAPADFMQSAGAAEIYIVKEDDTVVSALAVYTQLEYSGQRGLFVSGACTHPSYKDKAYLKSLVDRVIQEKQSEGHTFRITVYTGEQDALMWNEAGFDTTISHRKCEIEIKRNIWQNADFDIVTASRFRTCREKFCDEKLVHHTAQGYGAFTAFMYTGGGSTAENNGACAVYYADNGQLTVREIFALSTQHATKLLQAIRERTGAETAVVYLPESSTLFLGEGVKEPAYLVKGLKDDTYINLMPY